MATPLARGCRRSDQRIHTTSFKNLHPLNATQGSLGPLLWEAVTRAEDSTKRPAAGPKNTADAAPPRGARPAPANTQGRARALADCADGFRERWARGPCTRAASRRGLGFVQTRGASWDGAPARRAPPDTLHVHRGKLRAPWGAGRSPRQSPLRGRRARGRVLTAPLHERAPGSLAAAKPASPGSRQSYLTLQLAGGVSQRLPASGCSGRDVRAQRAGPRAHARSSAPRGARGPSGDAPGPGLSG